MDFVTHYAQLAETVEFSRDPDSGLVLRGSEGSLDDLIDHFVHDDLDGFYEAHPGVSDYHVERVAEILADLLRDVPDERSARWQLRKQAHWALLSERASRLIEREVDELSEPPRGEELLELAWRALSHIQPRGETDVSSSDRQENDRADLPGNQRQPTASRTVSSESLDQALAELAGISSRIRDTADQLQAHLPIHASYARELATRLDEIVGEAAILDR